MLQISQESVCVKHIVPVPDFSFLENKGDILTILTFISRSGKFMVCHAKPALMRLVPYII